MAPRALRRPHTHLPLLLLASALALFGAALPTWPVALAGSASGTAWQPQRLASGGVGYLISEPGYSLSLAPNGPWLTLSNGVGTGTIRMPLAALIGRPSLPARAKWSAAASGSRLTVSAKDGSGHDLLQALVTVRAGYFTVHFTCELGTAAGLEPAFFAVGQKGLDMSRVTSGFTPDPVFRSPTLTPTVRLGPIAVAPYTAPFAPPPFDVELESQAGWVGVGLQQVPNATQLSISKTGRVQVNYQLGILSRIRDIGAGGTVAAPQRQSGSGAFGRWLSFPTFVITLADSSRNGLVAYHDALSAMGAAATAAPPGHRPSWLAWPLVDTWGQQLVTGAARREDEFTAAWVRQYVAVWRAKFHLQHFTVIIDAQWQATLGGATPSARFGGVAGMRTLVNELHAQGIKVLLWWPLWVTPKGSVSQMKVDPTSTGFAATLKTQMQVLLGSGPQDLHVDGLKLDWGSLMPAASTFSRPQLGVGAAALLRYMRSIAQDAWGVQPAAVIDASAMAPQFVRYEDLVRLYDANTAEAWSDRASTVSAVDPLTLMDGDGWRLTGAQAIPHIVGSAVFGTPALYYATRWGGGAPISTAEAAALGALIAVTQGRGQGTATPLNSDPLTGDDWAYTVGGRLAAQTLDGARAAVVYHYSGSCRSPSSAEVVSVNAGRLVVPLPGGATLLGVSPDIGATTVSSPSPGVALSLGSGVAYTLELQPGSC